MYSKVLIDVESVIYYCNKFIKIFVKNDEPNMTNDFRISRKYIFNPEFQVLRLLEMIYTV